MMLSEMGFDKLKGIGGERRVVEAGPRAELEKLLEVERWFTTAEMPVKKFCQSPHEAQYTLVKHRLHDVHFDEADLVSFVLAKSNHEYDAKRAESLGAFTGILLEILTRRSRKALKYCKVHIDGQGARFDNLFSNSRVVDDLFIENFKGLSIASELGSRGDIKRAVFRNIEGGNLGSRLVEFSGYADTVMLIGCKGAMQLQGATNSVGRIAHLVLAGNEGNWYINTAGGVTEALLMTRNNITIDQDKTVRDGLICVAAVSNNNLTGSLVSRWTADMNLLVMDGNSGNQRVMPFSEARFSDTNLAYLANHEGDVCVRSLLQPDKPSYWRGSPMLFVSENNRSLDGAPWCAGSPRYAIMNRDWRAEAYGPQFCDNIKKEYRLAEIAELSKVDSDDPAVLQAAVRKIREIYTGGTPVDKRILMESIDNAAYNEK